MIAYRITSHNGLDGVRLSKLGHWGNIPHPDDNAAELAAEHDARGAPFRIERKHFPALPAFKAKAGGL